MNNPHRDPTGEAVAGLAERIAAVAAASVQLAAGVAEHVERLVTGVLADSREVAEQSEALYRVAAARAAALGGVLRATPRAARTTGVVLRIATAYRLQRARAELLSPERAAREREALHRRAAEQLHDLCVELRGGVLKLGQFVSTRMDLLPRPYVEALSRLQDRVPPVPFAAIAARIEEDLGAPVTELFASIEPTPIAAASLAQVHRATLHDGRSVAVKVQVPGIEDQVEADLAALSVLATVLADALPQLDLATIAGEVGRSLRAELDYTQEAQRARAFAANFAADARVVVPRLHDALCTRRVLTMEHVAGEPLVSFLDACERSGDGAGAAARDHVLATLVDVHCAQVLRHGLFQGDPHPGNFLVADGRRLVLLDFGAARPLDDATRRAYGELAGAILVGNARRAATLLHDLGFRTASGDAEPLVELAELVLELFRESAATSLADVDPERSLAAFLGVIEANPVVQLPDHFVLLGRVFAALGGLLVRYRPRIGLFGILVSHLAH